MRSIDYFKDLYIQNVSKAIRNCQTNFFSNVTWKDGLKFTIVNSGEVKCVATSSSSFEVYCEVGGGVEKNSQVISQAIVSDFILNSRRVKQQYKTAISMKDQRKAFAAPWILVSIYYSAFFSANELLRLNNIVQIGLSSEDRSLLVRRSEFDKVGCASDFIAAKPKNFSGIVKEDRIVFSSCGDRPHEKAWQLAAQQLNKVIKEKAWAELHKFSRFVQGLDGWIAPNELRNNWNYKRSDWYSDKGRSLCQHMFDITGSPKDGFEWMARAQPVTEASHCSNLSALNDLLALPVINSYESLFKSGVLE